MDSDWQDMGPDACRARREIYNECNGRIFTFAGEAYLVEDRAVRSWVRYQGRDRGK
jgi:hypothetical protein